jgi:hypothetical protein
LKLEVEQLGGLPSHDVNKSKASRAYANGTQKKCRKKHLYEEG